MERKFWRRARCVKAASSSEREACLAGRGQPGEEGGGGREGGTEASNKEARVRRYYPQPLTGRDAASLRVRPLIRGCEAAGPRLDAIDGVNMMEIVVSGGWSGKMGEAGAGAENPEEQNWVAGRGGCLICGAKWAELSHVTSAGQVCGIAFEEFQKIMTRAFRGINWALNFPFLRQVATLHSQCGLSYFQIVRRPELYSGGRGSI